MSNGNSKNLPPVEFVKEHSGEVYNNYTGRVVLREGQVGILPCGKTINGKYVALVDKDTGEEICKIHKAYEEELLKHKDDVISFRGKVNCGVVIPHVK